MSQTKTEIYAEKRNVFVDSESGEVFLSEISINGGTKGARIGRNELDQKKQTLLEDLAQKRR